MIKIKYYYWLIFAFVLFLGGIYLFATNDVTKASASVRINHSVVIMMKMEILPIFHHHFLHLRLKAWLMFHGIYLVIEIQNIYILLKLQVDPFRDIIVVIQLLFPYTLVIHQEEFQVSTTIISHMFVGGLRQVLTLIPILFIHLQVLVVILLIIILVLRHLILFWTFIQHLDIVIR